MKKDSNDIVDSRASMAKKVMKLFFKREVSAEVLWLVQEWLLGDDNVELVEDALHEVFDEMVVYEKKPRKELVELLPELWEKIGGRSEVVKRAPLWRKPVFVAAAVLVPILIVLGVSLIPTDRGSIDSRIAEPLVAEVIAPMNVIATQDESTEVVLPDGSLVWLGANSSIGYGEDFTAHRVLTLDGEAYFSVVKHANQFEVLAGDLVVSVLGTEFFVRSHVNDALSEVALVSGKVDVRNCNDDCRYSLVPSDMLVLDNISNSVSTTILTNQQLADIIDRAYSILTYSLDEILANVGAVYGVDVSIANDLPLDSRLKMKVDGGVGIEDTMYIIQKAAGSVFEYRIEGDILYVYEVR